MIQQATELTVLREQKPDHGDAQQNISCISNPRTPWIIIHRQPTSLPVIVERRLIEAEALRSKYAVH